MWGVQVRRLLAGRGSKSAAAAAPGAEQWCSVRGNRLSFLLPTLLPADLGLTCCIRCTQDALGTLLLLQAGERRLWQQRPSDMVHCCLDAVHTARGCTFTRGQLPAQRPVAAESRLLCVAKAARVADVEGAAAAEWVSRMHQTHKQAPQIVLDKKTEHGCCTP